MTEKFNIWEGIYQTFQEANHDAIGPGFSGDVYRMRVLNVVNECLTAIQKNKPMPHFHKQRSTLLPPVVAMMLGTKNKLRILDFGGGLGIGYLTLIESIPNYDKCIKFTIVEIPEICDIGRKLFLKERELTFLDLLPYQDKFDLLYSASALQYIEDYQQVLKLFSGYGAEYIILSDVFAGSTPTFVTLQNYYGSRIPHWFWNLDELLAIFSSIGYRLIMKSFVSSLRLGIEDTLPMNNFPETHRLEQTLHLLLQRYS